jgi:hypothetical protein
MTICRNVTDIIEQIEFKDCSPEVFFHQLGYLFRYKLRVTDNGQTLTFSHNITPCCDYNIGKHDLVAILTFPCTVLEFKYIINQLKIDSEELYNAHHFELTDQYLLNKRRDCPAPNNWVKKPFDLPYPNLMPELFNQLKELEFKLIDLTKPIPK